MLIIMMKVNSNSDEGEEYVDIIYNGKDVKDNND